ncbi:hypothetical protein [Nostoc sp. DedQUE07]|uniref:hypothetical protein n=1 Tax=Nostoc sp. DedQUE07 TaxID=3075392 RepID=UPI002AD4E5FA|nr:hypothetical protein [Nostoc sp. DedQUE07]MDZ8131936.1 hypothetical protein [Nostoc sp. DedQUE07]
MTKIKYFHTLAAYGMRGPVGHCSVDRRYTTMLDIGDLVFFMTSKTYGVLVAFQDGWYGYCIQTLAGEKACDRRQFRLADISEIDYSNRSERRFLEVHSFNARAREARDVLARLAG